MNVLAQLGHHESGLIDPWDFQDPAANPPAPCRSIPITEEIRARDAAAQAARAPSSDWKIKSQLSLDNLRLVRRAPVGPLRREDRPRLVAIPRRIAVPRPRKEPKPARIRPKCGECKANLKCATPECKRLLRFPRTEGVCGVCMDRTVQRKETVERYRQKKIAEAGKTCKVCRVPIKWDTKTECCIKHAAQLRSTRVILHAATREEHELNVHWSALSLKDKRSVLLLTGLVPLFPQGESKMVDVRQPAVR